MLQAPHVVLPRVLGIPLVPASCGQEHFPAASLEPLEFLIGHVAFAVGDSWQQLYSWRAADNTVISEIENQPTTKILKLPISYRCPKKVIDLAKFWVPDITCPDSTIDGEISNIHLNELYKMI